MAKLKIVIAGAPVLREVAQPVERIDKKLQRLLRDMAETMYAADGVGLAAPQGRRDVPRKGALRKGLIRTNRKRTNR